MRFHVFECENLINRLVAHILCSFFALLCEFNYDNFWLIHTENWLATKHIQ